MVSSASPLRAGPAGAFLDTLGAPQYAAKSKPPCARECLFGPIGGSEIILILGLALLVFGPRKLPEIGKTIGRTVAQLRRAAMDFKLDLEREVRVEEVRETRKNLGEIGNEVEDAVRGVTPRVAPPGSAAQPSPSTGVPPGDAPGPGPGGSGSPGGSPSDPD